MKIEKLILRNFAGIKVACHTDELEIDFTKGKHKIILLTGPNGSGKTTILSCLHPFAYNGNLDTRSNEPIISQGKKGYKEIHIKKNYDRYVISHTYTPNSTGDKWTVKSGIVKNGTELNIDGNQTSFKSIIKEELHLEQEYLKLSRLGNNVTNFIDMKPTERKGFMGKILESITAYTYVNKKVTMQIRSINAVIKHLNEELKSLNISDIETTIEVNEKIKKKEQRAEYEMNQAHAKFMMTESTLSIKRPMIVIKEQLDSVSRELEYSLHVIGKDSIESCKESLEKTKKKLEEVEKDLLLSNSDYENHMNTLDRILSEKDDLQKELVNLKEDKAVSDIEYKIEQIKEKIATRAKNRELNGYEPLVTKAEYEHLIISLDQIMNLLYQTYEFGLEPIKKAIEYIQTGEDINSYIANRKERVEKNKLQVCCEYVYNTLFKNGQVAKPNCKSEFKKCFYYDFYNQVYELAVSKQEDVVEDDTFVTYTKMAYQSITMVIKSLSNLKEIMSKLPEYIKSDFLLATILEKIGTGKLIYRRELLYHELSLATEYELQEQDRMMLKELKEKLSLYHTTDSTKNYMVASLEKKKEYEEEERDYLVSLRDTIVEQKKRLSSLQKEKTLLEEKMISLERKEELVLKRTELTEEFRSVIEIQSGLKTLQEDYEQASFLYEKVKSESLLLSRNIERYYELTKQIKKQVKIVRHLTILQNATSASKEGIPSIYIDIYFSDLLDTVNSLLDIVYQGSLRIEKFDIQPTSFYIPYRIHGKKISDVIQASQGETSFITLALSFALTCQSLSEYNIMLLDEIDAALDKEHRYYFIPFIERMVEETDAEQIFLISHNDTFNNYPVDVIDMKNQYESDNDFVNVIPIIGIL